METHVPAASNTQALRVPRCIWVVIAIAVLLRLAAVVVMGDRVEALPGIHDQISYQALAERLLTGHGFSFDRAWYPFTVADTPTAHWSFAYPLYLAAVYSLTGLHPIAPRILQAILAGALMVWLVYRLGLRLFSHRDGVVAAAWSALYPYFIYYAAALMTEAFFIVGLLATLDRLLAFRARPSWRQGLVLGLLIGSTTLLRQTILPLAPVLLALVAWENRRRMPWRGLAAAVVALVVVVAPFTVRNLRVYGQFLLLNSNAGYALWAANHPSQGAYWHPTLETAIVPIPNEWLGANEAILDQMLSRDAMRTMLANPLRIVALSASKAVEQFKFWPDLTTPLLSTLTRVLSFGVALPFMIAGLLLTLRRWREFFPLYVVIILYNTLFLVSWPSARYRLASDAVMLVFAAFALSAALRRATAAGPRVSRNV